MKWLKLRKPEGTALGLYLNGKPFYHFKRPPANLVLGRHKTSEPGQAKDMVVPVLHAAAVVKYEAVSQQDKDTLDFSGRACKVDHNEAFVGDVSTTYSLH